MHTHKMNSTMDISLARINLSERVSMDRVGVVLEDTSKILVRLFFFFAYEQHAFHHFFSSNISNCYAKTRNMLSNWLFLNNETTFSVKGEMMTH